MAQLATIKQGSSRVIVTLDFKERKEENGGGQSRIDPKVVREGCSLHKKMLTSNESDDVNVEELNK